MTARRAAWGWGIAGLVLAAIAALALAAHERALARSFQALHDRGQNTLSLTESTIRGQLERFERLPELLADQRVIRSLLLAPRDPDLILAANTYLRDTAELLGASDLYVMYRDGETLAASNFTEAHSFVGGNFAFRPYFFDAIASGQGRFYALGTTSNKRGYYFGAAIDVANQRLGVMVLKVDVDDLESAWASEDLRILVTDPEEIVFLSNRPDWLFRALAPLTEARLARTQETRRYANATLGEIDVKLSDAHGTFHLLTGPGADGAAQEYLVSKSHMAEAEWTVQVLLPTDAARAQARASVAIGILALGLAGLSGLILWQRRRQMAVRLEMEQAAKDSLERRVTERTQQLRCANAALEEEVAERRATEARLRKAQSELVQAGKLAALGQMSAALSHEFNQPLGAARNYAENAQLFLAQDRQAEAQGNIERILSMIDRMTRISRHLRNFARKPNKQLRPVMLIDVVTEAQELLGFRLRKAGLALEVDLAPEAACVIAGPVRLQQVLVNLLSNAIDAMEGQTPQPLHLSARMEGGRVQVRLRDHGPGIDPAVEARIFDPFFTTKPVGRGLGLGLSISYNIMRDFGGSLSVRNHPQGGAEFLLDLAPAELAQAAE